MLLFIYIIMNKQTKGGAMYLIFPVIVIVISAMFTFYFCPNYEMNIVERTMTMTMTGKIRYIAPPKVLLWALFIKQNWRFERFDSLWISCDFQNKFSWSKMYRIILKLIFILKNIKMGQRHILLTWTISFVKIGAEYCWLGSNEGLINKLIKNCE